MNATQTKSQSQNKLVHDRAGGKPRKVVRSTKWNARFRDGKSQLTESERKGFGHVWSRMIGKVGA